MRNRQLDNRVLKVLAPDIGVCLDFMKGGTQARPLSCFQKVGYALYQKFVAMILLCTRGTGVGMMVPNGL